MTIAGSAWTCLPRLRRIQQSRDTSTTIIAKLWTVCMILACSSNVLWITVAYSILRAIAMPAAKLMWALIILAVFPASLIHLESISFFMEWHRLSGQRLFTIGPDFAIWRYCLIKIVQWQNLLVCGIAMASTSGAIAESFVLAVPAKLLIV